MPTIGVLDALLLAGPVSLAALGMIRGAGVELSSCVSTGAGLAAAWLIAFYTPMQTLGTPLALSAGLACGLVVWRLARPICQLLTRGQRPKGMARALDGLTGLTLGAVRGIAVVATACFAYASVLVPLGLHDPAEAVAYPVYLQVAARATGVAVADPVKPVDIATRALPVPIGAVPAAFAPAPVAATPMVPAILRAIAPSAAAAPVVPRTVDVPVRQVPASMIETHHNLLHPFGLAPRRPRH